MSDANRKAFEAWVVENTFWGSFTCLDDGETYASGSLQDLWKLWQACTEVDRRTGDGMVRAGKVIWA